MVGEGKRTESGGGDEEYSLGEGNLCMGVGGGVGEMGRSGRVEKEEGRRRKIKSLMLYRLRQPGFILHGFIFIILYLYSYHSTKLHITWLYIHYIIFIFKS